MFDPKTIIGVVAVILTFIGYFPYIRDILRKKTRPHVFSWLIWSVLIGIIYALQVSAGAGAGSWVTLSLMVIMVSIFFLSLEQGRKDIKKVDVILFLVALFALPLWLVLKQPVLSIILLSSIDMLGFVPTIRKSWADPYSETLSFYIITTFRHVLALFALSEYNVITYLSPVSWAVANALFTMMLIIRRKKLV